MERLWCWRMHMGTFITFSIYENPFEKCDNDYENGNLPENLRKEKNVVDFNVDTNDKNEQNEKNWELNDEKEIEYIITVILCELVDLIYTANLFWHIFR